MKNILPPSMSKQLTVVLITMFLFTTSALALHQHTRTIELTAFTDQPQYYLEEEVVMSGELTDNGTGVENSPVCLDVIDSAGNPVIGSCFLTNDQGRFTFPLTLQNTTALGVCHASVHAVVYDIYTNITFEVVSTTITVEAMSPGTGTAGVPIDFMGSAIGGKTPYTWLWDFDDNTTSSEQNPIHTYTTPGQYTVILSVTDLGNFSGVDTTTIAILPPQNHPPNAPVLTGLTNGQTGESIEFIISAVDPDGDAIDLFIIDTGDGHMLNPVGPFASGQNVSFSYVWTQPGTYTMRAQATDEHQTTSNWSDPFVITIVTVKLNITMKGGFGLAVDIQNTGEIDVTNITITVNISGGILILPRGGQTETTIDLLPAQQQAIIRILALGIGKVSITVLLQQNEMPPEHYQINALILGVLVLILP